MNPNKVKSIRVPMPSREMYPSRVREWGLCAVLTVCWLALLLAITATGLGVLTGGDWLGALGSAALPLIGVTYIPKEWRLQRNVNRLARAAEDARAEGRAL